MAKPVRHHGCGASVNSNNETVLVVFGGLSGTVEHLNEIIILNLNDTGRGWRKFQFGSLPYSNIILKSFVYQFDKNRCEIMFVGLDGLYICKKNFIWTKKLMPVIIGTKFSWMGIARLNSCWRAYDSVIEY